MAWSWTGVQSGWTSPSQKDLTPQHLEFTWAGPHTEEAAQAVPDAIHVTTTVVTTVDMTEVDTTAMMTGTTTDHTEGDLLHLTTEALTGLDRGHGLILPVDIEGFCPLIFPNVQNIFFIFFCGGLLRFVKTDMTDFRVHLSYSNHQTSFCLKYISIVNL